MKEVIIDGVLKPRELKASDTDTLSIEHEGVDKKEYFAKFGFEVPEFECEIWVDGDSRKCANGWVILDNGQKRSIEWRLEDGSVYQLFNFDTDSSFRYNLTPIKDEPNWWEDESNFPALVYSDIIKSFHVKYFNEVHSDYYRLATIEELNSLHVERKEG